MAKRIPTTHTGQTFPSMPLMLNLWSRYVY